MKKSFAMDDERLKNLGGGGYFRELLVQNKIHYAVSGESAAEVIYHRADVEMEVGKN